MRRIINKVGVDGLLHILASGFLVLASVMFIGNIYIALAVSAVAGLAKEGWDFFLQKDNSLKDVGHDLICDLVGLTISFIIYLIS